MTEQHYFEEEQFHSRFRKNSSNEKRAKQKRSKSQKTPPFIENPQSIKGRAISISKEGIWVQSNENTYLCSLKGTIKKEKNSCKNCVAVGDFVLITPTSKSEGTIDQILPRQSILSRTEVIGKKEQLIAVNVDQILIVTSVGSPPLKPALIDRYLIAAEAGNLASTIVINKIDLLTELPQDDVNAYREFIASYEPLGIPILSISTKTGAGLENFRKIMQGKASVLAGQSGVGKSSILNVAYGLLLKTGNLTQKTAKGSHTTTTTEMQPLPGGGFYVDTPGIRSFAIWNLSLEMISNHFREFHIAARQCRFSDCSHMNEPDCHVKEAVQKGVISSMRYESYQNLMITMLKGLDNRTQRESAP